MLLFPARQWKQMGSKSYPLRHKRRRTPTTSRREAASSQAVERRLFLQRTPVRLGKDGNGRPGAETSSTEILRNQMNPQREQQSGWRQNIILQCILSTDPPIRSILNHVIQSPWMDFFITIIIVPGCRAPRDESSTSAISCTFYECH